MITAAADLSIAQSTRSIGVDCAIDMATFGRARRLGWLE